MSLWPEDDSEKVWAILVIAVCACAAVSSIAEVFRPAPVEAVETE